MHFNSIYHDIIWSISFSSRKADLPVTPDLQWKYQIIVSIFPSTTWYRLTSNWALQCPREMEAVETSFAPTSVVYKKTCNHSQALIQGFDGFLLQSSPTGTSVFSINGNIALLEAYVHISDTKLLLSTHLPYQDPPFISDMMNWKSTTAVCRLRVHIEVLSTSLATY